MTSVTPTVSQAPARTVMVDVYQEQAGAPIWHQGLVAAWFLVCFVTFKGNQLLLYPLVGFFLARLVLNYQANFNLFRRSWILFVMPVFAYMSFTWSPYPSDAMRTGLFYVLTPIILLTIAADLTPRQILRAMLFAVMILSFMCFAYFGTLDSGGPYGSKNMVGMHMSFSLLFALWAVLNKGENSLIRLMAIPFVFTSILFVIMANSATAIVFSLLVFLGIPAMRLFWVNMAGTRHLRSVTILFFAFLALVVINLLLNQTQFSLVNEILAALGKDSTLSGRTELWEGAKLAAAQNPLFGTGLEGFWQYDVGLAQTLNENDHKAYGTKLTFHNAFLEVRVHLGLIGWLSFSAIVVWCMWHTIRGWFTQPTMERSAFLIGSLIALISTMSESMLWGPFNACVTIFYLSALTAISGKRIFVGQMPLKLNH